MRAQSHVDVDELRQKLQNMRRYDVTILTIQRLHFFLIHFLRNYLIHLFDLFAEPPSGELYGS